MYKPRRLYAKNGELFNLWGTGLPAARSLRFWNGTDSNLRRSGTIR
jgi:hypothetical protein